MTKILFFFNKTLNGSFMRKVKLISFVLILLFSLAPKQSNAQWTTWKGLPIAYWDFELNSARTTTLETTVEQAINSGNTFDGKFGGSNTTVSIGTATAALTDAKLTLTDALIA